MVAWYVFATPGGRIQFAPKRRTFSMRRSSLFSSAVSWASVDLEDIEAWCAWWEAGLRWWAALWGWEVESGFEASK